MKIPISVKNRILVDLVAQKIFDQKTAEEVTSSLTEGTLISWEEIINRQIKNEKAQSHEA